jgi:hypothetical protein
MQRTLLESGRELHPGMQYAVGGLNLSPQQSATTAAAPAGHARVCLAAPPPASATLLCRRPEQGVRRKRDGEILGEGLFVPK